MSSGEPSPVLEGWLDTATVNLESKAAARIRREYRAHLADALAAGESQTAFLAGLGAAQEANQRFMRSHLTLSTVTILDSPRGPLNSKWLAVYSLFAVLAVAFGFLFTPARGLLVSVLILAGFGVWWWGQRALRTGTHTRRQIGHLYWNGSTLIMCLSMAAALNSVMFLLMACTALSSIAPWRKLRQDAAEVV